MDRFRQRDINFKTILTDKYLTHINNFTVKLRKERRTLEHAKRRALNTGETQYFSESLLEDLQLSPLEAELVAYDARLSEDISELEKLHILKSILDSDHPSHIVHHALAAMRIALSKETNTPLSIFVSLNFIPIFLKYTDIKHSFPVIFEASWCLLNIASGPDKYCEQILPGIPKLMLLLTPQSTELTDNVLWTLNNLAGNNRETRQCLLGYRIIDKIYILTKENPPVSLLETIAWSCANLTKDPDLLLYIDQVSIVEILQACLSIDNHKIHGECLWALANLSKKKGIHLVLPFVQHALSALSSGYEYLRASGVRIIGNISSGDTNQAQVLIDNSILDCLLPLIDDSNPKIRQEVLWTLSNIAAGSENQISALVVHPCFYRASEKLLDSSLDVKIEAAFILRNIFGSSSNPYLLIEVAQLLDVIGRALSAEWNTDFTLKLLQVCLCLLETAKKIDHIDAVLEKMLDTGCKDAIEQNLRSLNSLVAGLALEICEYFETNFIEIENK